MPPSSKPEVGDKEFVVVFKVVLGDVVVDIVFVVGVDLHSLLKSVRVPGTVQLNFAACSKNNSTCSIA